jgi:hypothetical protein
MVTGVVSSIVQSAAALASSVAINAPRFISLLPSVAADLLYVSASSRHKMQDAWGWMYPVRIARRVLAASFSAAF